MQKFGETLFWGISFVFFSFISSNASADSNPKNYITPKMVQSEVLTSEKILSGSCQTEAIASENEVVLREVFKKTNKRAIELRAIERDHQLAILNPEEAIRQKTIQKTLGKTEEEITRLKIEKERLSKNYFSKKGYSLEQRRELKLAELSKKPKSKLKEESKEAQFAVLLSKNAEYKLKKTELELSAWEKKRSELKNKKIKNISPQEIARLKKQTEKELKVITTLVDKMNVLEGKSKNCYRLAIQKRMREKCVASLGGAESCRGILPAFEQELLKTQSSGTVAANNQNLSGSLSASTAGGTQ